MGSSPSPSITLQNVSLAYQDKLLFHSLNCTLPGGKTTCLLGQSGVGKSSLLRMIAHLKTPDTFFEGKILWTPEPVKNAEIAYMSQSDSLMPWLTALENILLGARLQGTLTPLLTEKAVELLSQLGLKNAMHQHPSTLSGGMRQRVALARTLLQDKSVVLMDEPFSALDTVTRFQLQTLTATLLKNRTVLWVTHDPLEALRLGDVIYILSGKPAILSAPLSLTSPTPRNPADPELIQQEALLFNALLKASEETQ